jgi:hypothetical protein
MVVMPLLVAASSSGQSRRARRVLAEVEWGGGALAGAFLSGKPISPTTNEVWALWLG